MPSFPLQDLSIGQSVSSETHVTAERVRAFAEVSGDFNPVHLDPEYAATTPFGRCIAHGPLTLALAAGLLGMELPGLGTIAIRNEVDYRLPVYVGDTIRTEISVGALDPERRRAEMTMRWTNQDDQVVAEGVAVVRPPKTRISDPDVPARA